MSRSLEELARISVDAGFQIHKELGPGLLESVYEAVLAHELKQRGLRIDRQVPVEIKFRGLVLQDGFRADIMVEGGLLIELKSVERLQSVHGKQVLTYLRLLKMPLGLLRNFGAATFKEGIKRIVNNHKDFAA